MSAVAKLKEDNPRSKAVSQPTVTKPQLRVLPEVPPQSHPVPFIRKTPHPYPHWLKLLMVGQRVSLGIALVISAGAIILYGLSANTNRRLLIATVSLESLEEQQQQLTSANAVFKNHLAETALSQMEVGEISPQRVIYLKPAPVSPPSVSGSDAAPPQRSPFSPEARRFFPQGY